jgi:hypothetical protein
VVGVVEEMNQARLWQMRAQSDDAFRIVVEHKDLPLPVPFFDGFQQA